MSGISSVGGMPQGMMRSFAPPSFSNLDSNSDGGVTLNELTSKAPGGVSDTGSQSRAAELFSKMDSDGDGTVTSAEKDTFDSDLQQRVSDMQFSAQMIASGGESGAPQGAGGPGGGPPPGGGASDSSATSEETDPLDTNGDGVVSLEERLAASTDTEGTDADVEALFKALDSDGDGSISEDELSSFVENNKPAGPPIGAAGPPPPPSDSDSTTADSGSSSDDTSAIALDILSAALSAYSSSSSSSSTSGDYWSSIFGTLDSAA